MSNETLKFVLSYLFAALIVALGFYALVLYEFALDPLIVGAFISLMTLACNHVFTDQQSAAQARRAQRMFDSQVQAEKGRTADAGVTITDSGPTTVDTGPFGTKG